MSITLSVVIPCLNEEKTLSRCIEKAYKSMETLGVLGEVIVADNCSVDASVHIARKLGVRVVSVSLRGYGSAILGGIKACRGECIIIGDGDGSYDFGDIVRLYSTLKEQQTDLVIGNRFKGGIEPGAMKFLNRYFGVPFLSGVGRLLYGVRCGDFHCGLRGGKRDSLLALNLRTTGMEFASEMIVAAARKGFIIAEVPVKLYRDGRGKPSHLRRWRDGFRHLSFLILYRLTSCE